MAEQRSAILLEVGTNEAEFLEFTVCGHHFGVNVHKVRQAVSWSSLKLLQVPNDTHGYLGEVALRGTTISVIDLQAKLSLPVNVEVERPLLLVMEFNSRTTGFLIDKIETIHRVSWQQFAPFEQVNFFSGGSSAVIGSITVGERVIQILDLEAMMGSIDETMNFQEDDVVEAAAATLDRSAIRLVYAEDSMTIQKLTMRLLTQAGFTNITNFSTGAEALRYLASEGTEADILLTDIEMPEMDGLTLCRRLRERAGPQLPVIFYSSMINDQMSIKCDDVGGDRCYSKPDIKGIIGAIDELYASARAA